MADTIERDTLQRAQAGDHDAFGRLTEPHHRKLLTHCYRMLGSLQDAEDMVQETLLRAWRRLDSFERFVSFRGWLYKIATNACLDFLSKQHGRTLPTIAYPAADPREIYAPQIGEPIWLEPFPDDLLEDAATSPEARYMSRESITLAFLIALQTLPPRQRAVLIMRDVLDFSASEVAASLSITIPAANSVLHRARVTMSKHYQSNGRDGANAENGNETIATLLDQYVRAWETADVAGLIALLRADATLTMPPTPSWFYGPDAIQAFLELQPFSGAGAGRWRLKPARANAQPAFELLRRDPASGAYQSVALQVLTLDQDQIAGITIFLKPAFFTSSPGDDKL